jgi:spore coat protein SA
MEVLIFRRTRLKHYCKEGEGFMHILMIAPEQIPVPGSGSVEICMFSIAKELAKHHKITLISRRFSGCKHTSRLGKLTIVRVPSGNSSKYISSVLNYIKGKRFDLIQVDNRPYYMAKVKKALPGIPISLFLHSLTFVPRTEWMDTSLDKANIIVANSSSLKDNLSQMFPKQKHKIHIVHLGVDVTRFKPATIRQKNRMKNKYKLQDAFTILFSGRVIPRKGVSELIKSTLLVRNYLPQAKLVIAGSGKPAYIKKLQLQANKWRVPVIFTGRIAHSKIHKIYRLADCFVCPSQRHEAFGLVNVEAMATGIPVVASDIGGIKEIIKHGENGYLVKNYKSPLEFAQSIIKIGQNNKLAQSFAEQGRLMVVNRFGWQLTANKLLSIYKSSLRPTEK